MRAATTKIPHLLCEKTYLKPQVQCVILFTIDNLFTRMLYMMGVGEKTRNTKEKTKNKEQIPRLVTLPSPRLRKRPTVFRCPKNTENKPDLP